MAVIGFDKLDKLTIVYTESISYSALDPQAAFDSFKEMLMRGLGGSQDNPMPERDMSKWEKVNEVEIRIIHSYADWYKRAMPFIQKNIYLQALDDIIEIIKGNVLLFAMQSTFDINDDEWPERGGRNKSIKEIINNADNYDITFYDQITGKESSNYSDTVNFVKIKEWNKPERIFERNKDNVFCEKNSD